MLVESISLIEPKLFKDSFTEPVFKTLLMSLFKKILKLTLATVSFNLLDIPKLKSLRLSF